jgi:hypothetical protein
MFEYLLLGLVALALILTIRAQFVNPGPRAALLNDLALIPQWKFFGQAHIASDTAVFDDLHLLARCATDGEIGEWQELLYWDDRPWWTIIWHPRDRFGFYLGQQMFALRYAGDEAEPTSMPYLVLLRYCLDQSESDRTLQFALASTAGRGERPVQLHFLSQWHSA